MGKKWVKNELTGVFQKTVLMHASAQVGSRAKEPERQWQMPAYRAVCARQLLPMREEVAEVVGALLLELGPQMAELEAAFDEEVAAAEGPMWQLVADAKRRLVRDACSERCTEVSRHAIAAIWVASPSRCQRYRCWQEQRQVASVAHRRMKAGVKGLPKTPSGMDDGEL